jgi:predicted AAA+ superfamily ATPase
MGIALKRELYLEKIRPFYDSDLIKIITGMRRCGKSTLLEQIKSEILSKGVRKDHMIHMNFELLDYADIRDELSLFNAIKLLVKDEDKYYIFFDEIQIVNGFEKAINSFKAGINCSIFITGSNGKLLSGELSTYLTGRFIQFRVMPFTFREVTEYRKLNGIVFGDGEFEDYIRWGGMPQRFAFSSEYETRIYLEDLYNSMIFLDIIQRSGIKDIDLLKRIIDFILDNSSRIFSANSVRKFLISEGRSISTETIYNHIDHILSSLMISKVKRYDIKGKRQLATLEKYYATDTSIMYKPRSGYSIEVGASLETIVHNELIARGYELNIGKIGDKEIDFIATKDDKECYIQVCYLMPEESIREREFRVLESVQNNYPKYVISMDPLNMSRNGIEHLNLVRDFLLSDKF